VQRDDVPDLKAIQSGENPKTLEEFVEALESSNSLSGKPHDDVGGRLRLVHCSSLVEVILQRELSGGGSLPLPFYSGLYIGSNTYQAPGS